MPDDKSYDLEIALIFEDEYIDNPDNQDAISDYINSIRRIFIDDPLDNSKSKIRGIRLIDILKQSMSETDLHFLSTRDRFDLDYLSYRQKPGGTSINLDI